MEKGTRVQAVVPGRLTKSGKAQLLTGCTITPVVAGRVYIKVDGEQRLLLRERRICVSWIQGGN
jgi:hypothetical protein